MVAAAVVVGARHREKGGLLVLYDSRYNTVRRASYVRSGRNRTALMGSTVLAATKERPVAKEEKGVMAVLYCIHHRRNQRDNGRPDGLALQPAHVL